MRLSSHLQAFLCHCCLMSVFLSSFFLLVWYFSLLLLFTVQSFLPSWSALPQVLIPILLPAVSKWMSTHSWHPYFLKPQFFPGLGTSPTDTRSGSPLLYMYWDPQTSSCMLPNSCLCLKLFSGPG